MSSPIRRGSSVRGGYGRVHVIVQCDQLRVRRHADHLRRNEITVTNGTAYDLRIRAESKDPNQDGSDVNHYRYSSWVTVSNKVPPQSVPRAPVLTATVGVAKLDLAWTAPTAGASPINGYDVHYKTAAAADQAGTGSDPTTGWVAITHSGTGRTASITGLTSGTPYNVRVRARNTQGSGPWSAVVTDTPNHPPLATPQNVRLTPGSGQITVTWDAVNHATGYNINYREGSSGTIQTGFTGGADLHDHQPPERQAL